MKSNILFLGDRTPDGAQFNFSCYSRLTDLPLDADWKIDVIIIPLLMVLSMEATKFIHFFLGKNPWLQFILIAAPKTPIHDLEDCTNKLPIFRILENTQIGNLELACLGAIEKSRKMRQNLELEALVRNQHDKLKNLYQELEERIEKRQKILIDARQKSIEANSRWLFILKATAVVQQAESLGEIERSLCEVLGKHLGIVSIRIFSAQQAQLFRAQQSHQKSFSIYEAALIRGSEDVSMGSVFFLKEHASVFKKEDHDFLQKVSEVVALAMDRLYKLEQAYAMKEHWEATFDAVADPVIIINSDYRILQFNSSFAKKSGVPFSEIKLKKCYQLLFHNDKPCSNCSLGKQFELEHPSANIKGNKLNTYKVFSHTILPTSENEKETLFVNQYHDVTDQLSMQSKIVESARMAEIGTIGSSIAHELNNPLGGMLSFTQLIKLDLLKSDPIYPDILELENGIKRCRDIIQNLLSFTRNSDSEKKILVDLKDVIARSLKIIELQSRSAGIELKSNIHTKINQGSPLPINVLGVLNHLTQAVQSVLQLSLRDNLGFLRSHKQHKGIIEVRLLQTIDEIQIQILDNGPAIEDRDSLNISIARQILRDHNGKIEFFPDQKPFKMAKISLPNPASV
jgi:nitrogen-specific signal transduction histidine kinase